MLNLARFGAAVLLVVAAGSNRQAKPAAAAGTVQVCLATAADASCVYPTSVLPAGGTELHAIFRLDPSEHFTTLAYTWLAVDVGTAAPPNSRVAIGTLPLQQQRSGVFEQTGIRRGLPPGDYRIDVTADGKPWKSVPFKVAPPPAPITLGRPLDLIPATPGKVWTYAFTQEAGSGAKITLPGITPGPDGKLHATVTLTVTPGDAGTVKVETRRNDALVFEEWWRLDDTGLSATRRHSIGEDPIVLKPPQKIVAYPPAPQTWTYQPDDRSYRQTYKMWGPLPIATPTGPAPGFVVLTEQAMGLTKLTAERHFAPGVGLVREIIITALGGDLLSRQELVLQK